MLFWNDKSCKNNFLKNIKTFLYHNSRRLIGLPCIIIHLKLK